MPRNAALPWLFQHASWKLGVLDKGEMYTYRLTLGWVACLVCQGWVNLLWMCWAMVHTHTMTVRHPRHAGCNGHNIQQLAPRALDGLDKFYLSRNIRVLCFLASSRNTLLPRKDVVSHLICVTLCKAASVKMRWDYILLGTTWTQRELPSPSALLPFSFFSELHVLPLPSKFFVPGFE